MEETLIFSATSRGSRVSRQDRRPRLRLGGTGQAAFRLGARVGLSCAALALLCSQARAQGAPLSRVYLGVEYLHMWLKDAPLAVPLVSTGPIETTHHGLLGPPENGADSTVLYGSPFPPAKGGNRSQGFSSTPGTRVTAGYSLDAERRYAIEASGFVLAGRSAGYT